MLSHNNKSLCHESIGLYSYSMINLNSHFYIQFGEQLMAYTHYLYADSSPNEILSEISLVELDKIKLWILFHDQLHLNTFSTYLIYTIDIKSSFASLKTLSSFDFFSHIQCSFESAIENQPLRWF